MMKNIHNYDEKMYTITMIKYKYNNEKQRNLCYTER